MKAGILGAGKFALVIYDLATLCGWDIDFFLVTDGSEESTPPIHGKPIIGLKDFDLRYPIFPASGFPDIRESMVQSLPPETQYPALIHPTAWVSPFASIAKGCLICAFSVIRSGAVLEKFTNINVFNVVGHTVEIGKYTTTGPSVSICGSPHIGQNVLIGPHVCISNTVTVIADRTVIGASSMIDKNVEDPGYLYYGTPALKQRPA